MYRSEALQRASQSTTNEDGAGVESSPRHKVNVKGTRGPGGKKVTQKYSCDGFDYTFISRLERFQSTLSFDIQLWVPIFFG